MKKNKTILIEIADGLLEIQGIPKDVTVIVRDYDTDGADPKTLDKDSAGINCYESVYTSEG
jgi:hypothetical protein